MSINENELLELNADLMVLIREKQEQGALADAIRLVASIFCPLLSFSFDISLQCCSACHLVPWGLDALLQQQCDT